MVFRSSIRFLLFLQCVVVLASGCATTEKTHSLTDKERAAFMAQVAAGSINEGDPTGALGTLLEAERLDPQSAYIKHLTALAYFYKNDSDTALTYAKKAVELDPNFTEANNTLGKLLVDSGAYAQAERYLERAAKDPLYRETYKPRTNLGILHYKRGEFAQAEIHLNKAIQDNPAAACVAYYYLGQVNLEKSKFSDAIENFDRATRKACGSYEEAHLALGIAYLRAKQFERARKKFVEVQTAFPDTTIAKKAMDQLRYLP